MKTKRKYTKEELENDPSLKWNSYQKWEVLWSDEYKDLVRFVGYEGEGIQLADLSTINLGRLYDPLKVRRHNQ